VKILFVYTKEIILIWLMMRAAKLVVFRLIQ